MKLWIWIWKLNLKSESEIWIWNLNLKSESEIWIWNLNLKSESWIWIWNLNLQSESESEIWIRSRILIWNLNLESDIWIPIIHRRCCTVALRSNTTRSTINLSYHTSFTINVQFEYIIVHNTWLSALIDLFVSYYTHYNAQFLNVVIQISSIVVEYHLWSCTFRSDAYIWHQMTLGRLFTVTSTT